MVDGKGVFCWQQTSTLEALQINMNRGKNSKAIHPDELNPFIPKQDRKKNSRISGKAAWGMFRQVVENTMNQ